MCVIINSVWMCYEHVLTGILIRRFNDEFVGRKIISFLCLKIIDWYSCGILISTFKHILYKLLVSFDTWKSDR